MSTSPTRAARRARFPPARTTRPRDVIDAADDVDWYKFTIAKSGYIRIMLGDLPVDYSLDLYPSTGALVGSSHKSGGMCEGIYRAVHAATYFVRVKSVAGP